MKVELSGHYGYRRLLVSAVPLMMAMVLSSVYSIVDGIFVAHLVGTDAFAAMNIIWPPIAMGGAFGLMVGTGGCALVSKTLGEGRRERAVEIFSGLVLFVVLLGLLCAVLMQLLLRPMALMLGTGQQLLPLALSYGRILVLGLPVFMLQLAFEPMFMAAERPQIGLFLSLACGLVNMALDVVLIYWLGMGLEGAALATVAAQTLGGMFPLWYFLRKGNTSHLRLKRVRLEAGPLLRSCFNGLSEYVGNVSMNIVSMCYNYQLMRMVGADGVTAYGIIMYMGFVLVAMIIGYNMTVSPVVSYNYGAGDRKEMRSLLRHSIRIMFLYGLAVCLILQVAAPYCTSAFLEPGTPVFELSVKAMRIYMLSLLLCGFSMFTSAWFTALNNGLVSAVAAFTRTLVFELSAVFILPALMGVDGIWYAVDVAEGLAFILSLSLILAFRPRYGY